MTTTIPLKYYGDIAYKSDECPHCRSKDLESVLYHRTLVGWVVGGEDNDPNHHTRHYKCRWCSLEYALQWVPRNKSTWATRKVGETTYLIAGKPGCFETYAEVPT